MSNPSSRRSNVPLRGRALFASSLGAVGVVYGDIGTSPLYAVRECFAGHHSVPPTDIAVLGVISLLLWSLICVVVIKYLVFLLEADNDGEGGVLALLSLVQARAGLPQGSLPAGAGAKLLLACGLFGAALLYGDGMITPAISVLSAVEGLRDANHALSPWVIPITIAILLGLFLVQERGTHRVGAVFGPMMVLYFVCIAVAAVPWILKRPEILYAFDPRHGIAFLVGGGYRAFLVLGSVVLCVTGGEALYADMGHFGRRPIRVAWFAIVYPALTLNYLGQGSRLLILGRSGVAQSFYGMFPSWALFPMIGIATAATIIASQALISGAFSLSRQAVQLGYSPRLTIVHTSHHQEGEIYVPEINRLLMVSCIALVLGFKSSGNLAAAYGIAVTGTMTITSLLYFVATRQRLGLPKALAILCFFLVFDVGFLSANLVKVKDGGWFPLLVAVVIFAVLATWKRGRAALLESIKKQTKPLAEFTAGLEKRPLHRVEGTAVFMSSNAGGAPPILLHHVRHNKVLHEQVILLSVMTERVPHVSDEHRIEVQPLGLGMFQVTARYGFLELPNVRELLPRLLDFGIDADMATTTFYLGRETLFFRGESGMWKWRKSLFAFFSRNALPATNFFNIPTDRVVEIGMQIHL